MANIEKRTAQTGEITYRVKVRLKGFPAQSATFERLTDAKKWIQQTETAIRENRYFKTVEAKRHTLSEAVDRYVQTILRNKPKSFDDRKRQLTWWSDQLGAYRLSNISTALIAEYRDKLAHEKTDNDSVRAPATVNRYLAALSHLFTVAVKEWQWMEENPVMKVSKFKEPRGIVRFLSDEERAALMEATKESESPLLHLAVVLALSTGARKMELFNLHWKDVDLARGMITVHETKNGERRVLPLVSYAKNLMQQHAKNRRLDSLLVFPAINPKRPVDLRTPWETALKRAGITDFRWHDLRHSAASYLAMNGASISEIAAVLGHKTLQMVKRYAHLSDTHVAKVVERMNERIFG